MGEIPASSPEGPRINVGVWAGNLSEEQLHTEVWPDVNKRDKLPHEIAMAARVFANSKLSEESKKSFLDGVAFALGAQAYHEDATTVVEMIGRPTPVADETTAVAEIVPINPTADAA